MKKFFIALGMAFAIVISVSGCGNHNNVGTTEIAKTAPSKSVEEKVEDAAAYLEGEPITNFKFKGIEHDDVLDSDQYVCTYKRVSDGHEIHSYISKDYADHNF